MKIDKTLEALKRLRNPKEREKLRFKVRLGLEIFKHNLKVFLERIKK